MLPTRRNITATEQRRHEKMERNRRINPDGDATGRAKHEQKRREDNRDRQMEITDMRQGVTRWRG